MSTVATVGSLDHIVLTVKDLEASIGFYERFLGMKHTSFTSGGVERHALAFGSQKINLHVSGKEFEPKAEIVQPGSGDLCFLMPDDVDEVLQRLKAEGVTVLEGGQVVDRTGARGKLRSVYIRDPDGNLLELVLTILQRFETYIVLTYATQFQAVEHGVVRRRMCSYDQKPEE